ncbi:MAG: hypothetical protein ACM3O4_04800 [Ignavibacteriales bacterium]
MKKLILWLMIVLILTGIYVYRRDLSNYFYTQYVNNRNLKISNPNQYASNGEYNFVEITDDFLPDNKQDILNILYTIIDSGVDEFVFYCPTSYENCINDVENLIDDTNMSSVLNNYVHPYNSYNNLNISFNDLGRVTVRIEKLYTDEEIEYINGAIDQISKLVIIDGMTTREKIQAFHDYIIKYTTYDSIRANQIKNNIDDPTSMSHKATGLLLNKTAICGGYTDTMAIFLSKINVPNIKVSTDDHIWNLVYIDNDWYHLDLTWDDTGAAKEEIIHVFFLISSNQLESLDAIKHNYPKNLYVEAN